MRLWVPLVATYVATPTGIPMLRRGVLIYSWNPHATVGAT